MLNLFRKIYHKVVKTKGVLQDITPNISERNSNPILYQRKREYGIEIHVQSQFVINMFVKRPSYTIKGEITGTSAIGITPTRNATKSAELYCVDLPNRTLLS